MKGPQLFASNDSADFPNYTELKKKIEAGEVEIITCLSMARAISTLSLRFIGSAERVDNVYNYPFVKLGKEKTGAYDDYTTFDYKDTIELGCENILAFLKKNKKESEKPYTLAIKVMSNFISEKSLRAIFAVSSKCIFIIRKPDNQIQSFTYCMLHEFLTAEDAPFSVEQANQIFSKAEDQLTEKEKTTLQAIEKQVRFQWGNMRHYHKIARKDYAEKLLTLDGEAIRNNPARVIELLDAKFPELGCSEVMAMDLSSTKDYLCTTTSHREGGLDKWNQVVRKNNKVLPAADVSAIEGKGMKLPVRLSNLIDEYSECFSELERHSITHQPEALRLGS